MVLNILSVAYPFTPVGPDAVGGSEQILTLLDRELTAAGHKSFVIGVEGSRTAGTLIASPGWRGKLTDEARRYAHLPGGHQEAWADAFSNVMRDVYGFIASGRRPDDPKPPAFATFEDGYRAACIVDAVLASQSAGNVWTTVRY